MRIPSPRLWACALLATLLTACGGGEGTTTTPAAGAPGEQNVVATGAITGFGSVYVNGVHFETSGATITRDDNPSTQGELRVGQIVHVLGRVDDRTGRAVAESVRQDDNLEGPITAVDAAAQTFVVLAHTVKVTADTSFDNSLGSFAALTVGLQVEVNGNPDASGNLVATRVQARRAGELQYEILGRVSALDTVARRFNIDQLVVDYSAATLRAFGPASIANGQPVKVKGATLGAAGELQASLVQLHDIEAGRNGFRREIEGLITRFVSATDFDVTGRRVTTSSTTVYVGGTAADLALNVKVEAEGSINAEGVLVATKVEFKRGNNAGLAGVVQTVTADTAGLGGTLTVLGVTVTVDNNTRVEDKSDARVEMFRLSNLQAGDYVIVRGAESAPLRLTASRLERRRPGNEVWVRGTVRDLLAPNFTALGVSVSTSAATSFRGTTSSAFFATAAGRVAKVKGTLANTQIAAREVEFEDHDD